MAHKLAMDGSQADGQRVLALWLLWLALFAILVLAGVAIVGGGPEVPAPPVPAEDAPPRRTGQAAPRAPVVVPEVPAPGERAALRRVAIELRRSLPGGATAPYLGPATVTGSDGALLTSRAAIATPAPVAFVLPGSSGRAVVRAAGFLSRSFALGPAPVVVLEPDAGVRLRIAGLPPAGGQVVVSATEDGVPLPDVEVAADAATVELTLALASARSLALGLRATGAGLLASWSSPSLQLRASEVRELVVDLGQLPTTTLCVHGPSPALLAGLPIALWRHAGPWVPWLTTLTDAAGRVHLRGVEGAGLRAAVEGADDDIPLWPEGTDGREFLAAGTVALRPEQPLRGIRLSRDGAAVAFALAHDDCDRQRPARITQVVTAATAAAWRVVHVRAEAQAERRFAAATVPWAGDLATLQLAAGEATGELRVTVAGEPPWWAAAARLVLRGRDGLVDGLDQGESAERTYRRLRPGRYVLSWMVNEVPAAPIGDVEVQPGVQALSCSWPGTRVFLGQVADWQQWPELAGCGVFVEDSGPATSYQAIPVDATGTFRLALPDGTAALPRLGLRPSPGCAVALRVDGLDRVEGRVRVRVDPAIAWVPVQIDERDGWIRWFHKGTQQLAWLQYRSGRVPVPAGASWSGVLSMPGRPVAGFVNLDGPTPIVARSEGRMVTVRCERAGAATRVFVQGPDGPVAFFGLQFDRPGRGDLFAPVGTLALRVCADGLERNLALDDEVVVR